MLGFFYVLLLATPPSGASIELGTQRALYRIAPHNHRFSLPSYANNGYEQKIHRKDGEFLVEIIVKNKQLNSKAMGNMIHRIEPRLSELSLELNQIHPRYLADQMAVLFQWFERELTSETQYVADQSLAKILSQREVNCVGLVNLSRYFLDKLGVKTRYVTGIAYLPSDQATMRLEGSALHRWLEVYYPDVGWVFSDPAGKVNFVEATYIVIAVEQLHDVNLLRSLAFHAEVELLKLEQGLQTIGYLPKLDNHLRVRPNRLFLRK